MIVTLNNAIEIAQAYQEKYGITGEINRNETCFYANFHDVDGPVWLVIVSVPPSSFEGLDHITIVVSIDKKAVDHFINRSGFPKFPHLNN